MDEPVDIIEGTDLPSSEDEILKELISDSVQDSTEMVSQSLDESSGKCDIDEESKVIDELPSDLPTTQEESKDNSIEVTSALESTSPAGRVGAAIQGINEGHGSTVSVNLMEDLEERENMTLFERKELKKKKAVVDKQKRLQDFLNVPLQTQVDEVLLDSSESSTTSSNNTQSSTIKGRFVEAKRLQQQQEEERLNRIKNDPNKRLSMNQSKVKDRFEEAKKMQQQQEEERLNRFKNDPNKHVNTQHNKVTSMKSMWTENPPYFEGLQQDGTSPATAATTAGTPELVESTDETKRVHKKSNIESMWRNVWNDTKTTENNRVQSTRFNTISEFRVTDGTGIVKKRIVEWEEVVLQISATQEQLEEFLNKAMEISLKREYASMKLSLDEIVRAQKKFQESCMIPEDFYINSTQIFDARYFDQVMYSYLKKILTSDQGQRTNHYTLSCGLYGDSNAEKPPLDIFAAAIRTKDHKIYVALTVKALVGKELDGMCYGIKKIVVMSRDVEDKIFEKVLNIIPMAGWEEWVENGTFDWDAIAAKKKAMIEAVRGTAAMEEQDATISAAASLDVLEELHLQDNGKVLEVESTEELSTLPTEGEVVTAVQELNNIQVEEESIDKDDLQMSSEDNQATESASKEGESNPTMSIPDEQVVEEDTETYSAARNYHRTLSDISAPSTPTTPIQNGSRSASPTPASVTRKEVTINDPAATPTNEKALNASTLSAAPADEGEGTWNETLTPAQSGNASTTITPFKTQENPAGRLEMDEEDEEVEEDDDDDERMINKPTTAPNNKNHHENRDFEDDDNEDVEDIDDDEDYNFGKQICLPSVLTARAIVPKDEHSQFPVKAVNESPGGGPQKVILDLKNKEKLSWPLEDERATELLPADHVKLIMNLRQVVTTYASINLFVIQNTTSCTMFTGTLKHASTNTNYMVQDDMIFEWIRGAATSGWCSKWPMKSQAFGRSTNRFFILRDHLLSYHKKKPNEEQDVFNDDAKNILHLTEGTTVEVGRKFLQKCLVITTPLDVLWIRMMNDFTADAVKWMNEIKKSIEIQQRPRYFRSKPKIESKWYHESPNFHLQSVDAVGKHDTNTQHALDDLYVKVGLYCYHTVTQPKASPARAKAFTNDDLYLYSVDIATSHSPRIQIEVLNEDETIAFPGQLQVVKVFGEWILVGGQHGYLGLGMITKTKSTVYTELSSIFRPSQNSSPPSTTHAPSNTYASVATDNPIPPRKALVVSSFLCKLQQQTLPHQQQAALGGRTYREGDLDVIYPHDASSTITHIAMATGNSIFATADSLGIISLWHLPRQENPCCFNSYTYIPNQRYKKVLQKTPLAFLCAIDTTCLDSAHHYHPMAQQQRRHMQRSNPSIRLQNGLQAFVDERIMTIRFVCHDSFLIVSTNRRLLLLQMNIAESCPEMSGNHHQYPTWSNAEEWKSYQRFSSFDTVVMNTPPPSVAGSSTAYRPYAPGVVGGGMGGVGVGGSGLPRLGFVGWVELDRALRGCYGIFDMFFSEEDVPPQDERAESSESQQQTPEDFVYVETNNLSDGGMMAAQAPPPPSYIVPDGKKLGITHWRAIEDEEDADEEMMIQLMNKKNFQKKKGNNNTNNTTASVEADGVTLKKCTVSRVEWSMGMFQAAVAKMKPFPSILYQ